MACELVVRLADPGGNDQRSIQGQRIFPSRLEFDLLLLRGKAQHPAPASGQRNRDPFFERESFSEERSEFAIFRACGQGSWSAHAPPAHSKPQKRELNISQYPSSAVRIDNVETA